jgi:hypothetical protein
LRELEEQGLGFEKIYSILIEEMAKEFKEVYPDEKILYSGTFQTRGSLAVITRILDTQLAEEYAYAISDTWKIRTWRRSSVAYI